MVRARQPVLTPTNLPYGEAGQLADAQKALPLGAAPPAPAPVTSAPATGGTAPQFAPPAAALPAGPPPASAPLSAPTNNPLESVMAGAPSGPGGDPYPMPQFQAEALRAAFIHAPTAALHDLIVELGLRNR